MLNSRKTKNESVDSTKYRGMIGSLLYLTASRPDIMFSVCLCARFQEDPKTSHLEAVKRIFRYIKGTTHLGFWYPKVTDIEIIIYADSNHAGDYVDPKSTSGICTFVGCCLTSWFLKKQTALTISTTEAKYVSAEKACQQALWMKQALIDYDIRLDDVPIMSERYNLAYFIAKQMEFVTKQPRLILPYDMLLTRLFKYVMSKSPELSNDRYVLYDHAMYPLTAQQERKTQKDYGTGRGRSSTSSSSAFGQPSSSDPNYDDGNNKGTSRASTPSPTHFVNSLSNDIPQIFSNPSNVDLNMEAFYSRKTKILNRQV
ncbi:hypothetical protein Tco_1193972 [Tanacetum coccineum]